MLTCKQITELATEYAEGALDVATVESFKDHLAGCDPCLAWVNQLEIAARAVGALPPPELPAELSDELLRRFSSWQERRLRGGVEVARSVEGSGPGRSSPWAAAAVVAAVAGLVAVARHPSHAAADWLIGLALVGAAIALAALLRRLTAGFGVAAASVALVAALVRGGEGPLAASRGLECLATEAAVAGLALGVAWLTARRGPEALVRGSLGAWAVAGALAGDGALQVSCPEHASLPHLLVFHAGGVLAVVAAGWPRSRRVSLWRRPF